MPGTQPMPIALNGNGLKTEGYTEQFLEGAQLMKDSITGWSASASATWYVGAGGSTGLRSPHNGTVEGVFGLPGVSITPTSYTFLIWETQ